MLVTVRMVIILLVYVILFNFNAPNPSHAQGTSCGEGIIISDVQLRTSYVSDLNTKNQLVTLSSGTKVQVLICSPVETTVQYRGKSVVVPWIKVFAFGQVGWISSRSEYFQWTNTTSSVSENNSSLSSSGAQKNALGTSENSASSVWLVLGIGIVIGLFAATAMGLAVWYLVKQIGKAISFFYALQSLLTIIFLFCVLVFTFKSYPETYIYFFNAFMMSDALEGRWGKGEFIVIFIETFVYALVLNIFSYLGGYDPDEKKPVPGQVESCGKCGGPVIEYLHTNGTGAWRICNKCGNKYHV